jgi:hypothetical protein
MFFLPARCRGCHLGTVPWCQPHAIRCCTIRSTCAGESGSHGMSITFVAAGATDPIFDYWDEYSVRSFK